MPSGGLLKALSPLCDTHWSLPFCCCPYLVACENVQQFSSVNGSVWILHYNSLPYPSLFKAYREINKDACKHDAMCSFPLPSPLHVPLLSCPPCVL